MDLRRPMTLVGIWLPIAVVICLAWNTPFLLPLKQFTVLLHELSHAIMTVATGGSVRELVITPDQGGHVLSQGGNRFLTLSAGYLGSMLWGGLICLSASRIKRVGNVSIGLGLLILILTLLWGRNFFGLTLGVASAAVLILLGAFVPAEVNRWFLRVVGFTSAMSAVWDIWSDVITRSELMSDARMLAEHTVIIPTIVWGILWILISLYGTWRFLLWSVPATETSKWKRKY